MVNRYSILLKFLVHLNSHFIFEFKGQIKLITVTYKLQNAQSINVMFRENLQITLHFHLLHFTLYTNNQKMLRFTMVFYSFQ